MSEPVRLLVTGASGFVGGAIAARAAASPLFRVRAASRRSTPLPEGVEAVTGVDLLDPGTWSRAVEGVDVVIHAAARVHVMHDTSADPLAEFRRVNVEGSLALASAARRAGARRFVFISSIKVNGEATVAGRPFTAGDAPAPADPYGVSKHEAEIALRALATDTGLEVTVIRPVLVYGPGVRGNFRSMIRWVERGVPLPLASVNNRRSLVALDNLVDLALTCAVHPAAAGETFLVSDGDDVSTCELLRRLARALDRPARLYPVPVTVLLAAATIVGRRDVARRVLGSLQVDTAHTRRLLGWTPSVGMDDALRRTVLAG